MLDNIKTDRKMDLAFIKVLPKNMKANGKTIAREGKEQKFGQMVQKVKGNGKITP